MNAITKKYIYILRNYKIKDSEQKKTKKREPTTPNQKRKEKINTKKTKNAKGKEKISYFN